MKNIKITYNVSLPIGAQSIPKKAISKKIRKFINKEGNICGNTMTIYQNSIYTHHDVPMGTISIIDQFEIPYKE